MAQSSANRVWGKEKARFSLHSARLALPLWLKYRKDMKKTLLSLLCAVALAACAAEDYSKVTINISGMDADSARVMLFNASTRQPESEDSMAVGGSSMSFNAAADKTHLAVVVLTAKGRSPMELMLLVLPQSTLTVAADATTGIYHYGGDKAYQEIDAADRAVESYSSQLSAMGREYMSATGKPGINVDSVQRAISERYAVVEKQRATAALAYIRANPDSYGSAYLLTMVGDSVKSAAEGLSERVKNSAMKDFYAPHVAQYERELARKEQAKNVADGMAAPDFTLTDINGAKFTLSSLRGKWVVLDFWGSWCVWCVKGIPDMKNTYEKYKSTGKLEFVSIDCNDTEQKWKEAVEKHQMPWLHVYNPRGEGSITKTYAIQGFPTKIVVDPQGNIAKTIVGEDPAFYDYIDNIMK